MSPYRISKLDANQTAIVRAFREWGDTVADLHSVGHGVPDILVGITSQSGFRYNVLVEIKDGKKVPSKQKLTPDEYKWHAAWEGQVTVVTSVEDADALHIMYHSERFQ